MMAVVSDNTTAVSDRVGTMTEGTTVVQDCTHSDTMLKVLDWKTLCSYTQLMYIYKYINLSNWQYSSQKS